MHLCLSRSPRSLSPRRLTAPAAHQPWKLWQGRHPRAQTRSWGTENSSFRRGVGLFIPSRPSLPDSWPTSLCLPWLALECSADFRLILPRADGDLRHVFPDGMQSLPHLIFHGASCLLLPACRTDLSTCPLAE